jgi:hypothetical protein
VDGMRITREGITGMIYRFMQPFIARYTYQYQRDNYLQRGLHFEDYELFSDREMRRCYLFETMMRQGFSNLI